MKCYSMYLAAGLCTLAPTAGAGPATLDAIMPPPGLYRVSTEAVHGAHGPGVQARQDGASGAETVRVPNQVPNQVPNPDGAAMVKNLAGTGPVTRCVPDRKAIMPVPPGCTATAPTVVDSAAHLASQCYGATIAMVIRKTGPRTWTYRTTVSRPAAAGADPYGGLPIPRAVLENAAAHAPTAEQRAGAARLLAEHPAQPPVQPTPPGAAAGGGRQASTIVQVATRIADSCGATR
jgi:hypothetical protein